MGCVHVVCTGTRAIEPNCLVAFITTLLIVANSFHLETRAADENFELYKQKCISVIQKQPIDVLDASNVR